MKRFNPLNWAFNMKRPADARPRPWLTLGAGALALAASQPEVVTQLDWQRSHPLSEFWRPLTAHFTHWSSAHLHWDLLVFLLFGATLERIDRANWCWVVAASIIVLSGALPFIHPELTSYRGLSGIDCALAGAVAADSLRSQRWRDRAIGSSILLFVFGKAFLEARSVSPIFVDATSAPFDPLPSAHILGALVGIATIVICSRLTWKKARKKAWTEARGEMQCRIRNQEQKKSNFASDTDGSAESRRSSSAFPPSSPSFASIFPST